MNQNVKKKLETLSLLNSVYENFSNSLRLPMCGEFNGLQSYKNSFPKFDKKSFSKVSKISPHIYKTFRVCFELCYRLKKDPPYTWYQLSNYLI